MKRTTAEEIADAKIQTLAFLSECVSHVIYSLPDSRRALAHAIADEYLEQVSKWCNEIGELRAYFESRYGCPKCGRSIDLTLDHCPHCRLVL